METKSGEFYKLTKDSGGFNKGTIVLLGNKDTMEFFDITTELSTGNSYSSYEIDTDNLSEFNIEDSAKIRLMFDEYINDNYKLNLDILNY